MARCQSGRNNPSPISVDASAKEAGTRGRQIFMSGRCFQVTGASGRSPSAFRASWHCSSPASSPTQQFGRVG